MLLLAYLGPLKNRQSSNCQFREQKLKAIATQSQIVYIKYRNSNYVFWLNQTLSFTNFKKSEFTINFDVNVQSNFI